MRRFGDSEEVEKEQTPEKSKKFKATLVFEDVKNLVLPLSKESSRVIKQIISLSTLSIYFSDLFSVCQDRRAKELSIHPSGLANPGKFHNVTIDPSHHTIPSIPKARCAELEQRCGQCDTRKTSKNNSQDIRTPIDGLLEKPKLWLFLLSLLGQYPKCRCQT